ncbi:MAG TPA: cupin domain-containing protein [Steroidobacteraceae bacterium]|nr:cupin domain-containing protein [Steroidobacteraceae bacterium]
MNPTNKIAIPWKPAATGFLAASALFLARDLLAVDPAPKPAAKIAFSEKLPNVPGKTLTGIHVSYPPGGKSASHAHAGSVYAYVLSGKVRSENSVTGPVRVYSAGEGFFEPVGSVHTISENASETEPATLLAIFVAEDGAELSRPVPQK